MVKQVHAQPCLPGGPQVQRGAKQGRLDEQCRGERGLPWPGDRPSENVAFGLLHGREADTAQVGTIPGQHPQIAGIERRRFGCLRVMGDRPRPESRREAGQTLHACHPLWTDGP